MLDEISEALGRMGGEINLDKLEWMGVGKVGGGDLLLAGRVVPRKKALKVLGVEIASDLCPRRHISCRIAGRGARFGLKGPSF